MYLTGTAIEATWRTLGSVAARGSEVVLDFIHPDVLSAPGAQKRLARARAVGEPIITGLDPGTLGADLAASGWTLVETLDAAEIDGRYFATRTDGYRARPGGWLAAAGIV